jgi:hypothetical protein
MYTGFSPGLSGRSNQKTRPLPITNGKSAHSSGTPKANGLQRADGPSFQTARQRGVHPIQGGFDRLPEKANADGSEAIPNMSFK